MNIYSPYDHEPCNATINRIERELAQANAKIAKYQALVRSHGKTEWPTTGESWAQYHKRRIAEIEST